MDVFFDGDGSGIVRAEGEDISFSYTQDSWVAVNAVVDIDGNEATVTIGSTAVHTWDWNVGNFGENDCPRLGGVDFYGPGYDSSETPADPGFYIDNVSVTQL